MTVEYSQQGSGPLVGTKEGPVVAAGMGNLSVTNSSVLISTMTLGPNSAAAPNAEALLFVKNWKTSSGNVYFFPFGGTAVDTAGLQMGPGEGYGIVCNPTLATIISDGTATVQFQW